MAKPDVFPSAPHAGAMAPSQIDASVARLKAGARRFARISLDERIALARTLQRGYMRIAAAAAEAATKAKGLPLEAAGDEWGSGPLVVVRGLRLIIESLEALKRTGAGSASILSAPCPLK